MGKKLAIRGHSTRGNEVIEILEMMGGKNIHKHNGEANMYSYYLYDYAILSDRLSIAEDDDFEIFTLQDFLEKFPYKVGDKVHIYVQNDDIDGRYDIEVAEITSMRWNPARCKIAYKMKDINREFYKEEIKCKVDDLNKPTNIKPDNSKCERTHEDVIFDSIIWHLRNSVNNGKQNLSGGECEDYFREVVKKNNENKMKNVLAELLEHIKTTPKKELEKEFKEIEEWSNVGPTVEEFMTFCESVNKYKYPTTYDDCYDEGNTELHFIYVDKYERDLYESFIQLIRCRNAYWKIAGERMGLGKPWEPDWNDHNQPKFGIHTVQNNIRPIALHVLKNLILIFPTEEMRDAFYENFKDLIEACKKLL